MKASLMTSSPHHQTDGWVSVFGKGWDGKWAEVVDQQVQLVDGKPTGVLFL
jgi:hypothetical protein